MHKLSSNESALGASPKAMAAYAAASEAVARYPDAAAAGLRSAIAEVHDLDPSRLVIGAGSDEIIQLLIRAFCEDGCDILQTRHAFSYYAIAALGGGARPVLVPEAELVADVDALIAAQTAATRILFLANPNNPTGTMLTRADVARLRQGLREDIILVLDGAYAEYVEDAAYTDGRDLVDTAIASGADNVVMMRTFSKIYGLGGLRVGWAYGPPHIIDSLNQIRGPFNVSGPALAAAEAAMRDQSFVAKNREFNTAERARLAGALTALGLIVTPSYGNFLLFTLAPSSSVSVVDVLAHLETHRVLIRPAKSSHLPDHLRVSVGDAAANDAFLAAMSLLSF